MTRKDLFVDWFWGSEFTGTAGFETLTKRLTDGRRFCKDVEDFIKQRSKLEEEYGQKLQNLARKNFGLTEIGTLRESWERLLQETEQIGHQHIESGQYMQDEIARVNSFMDGQKEHRKKVEENVKKHQQRKEQQFKKLVECKKAYNSKCQNHEKAKEDVQSVKSNSTSMAKHIEKSQDRERRCKEEAIKADEGYKMQVGVLEVIRQEWDKEWSQACEQFQKLEEERIQFLRNELWTHTNISLQNCVLVDEHGQKILDKLETCLIEEDISVFIKEKQTGREHPAPIVYENFYNGSSCSFQQFTGIKQSHTISRRPALPLPADKSKSQTLPDKPRSISIDLPDESESDGTYAMVNTRNLINEKVTLGQYKCVKDYTAKNDGEINLQAGWLVVVTGQVSNARLEGHVITDGSSSKRGIFPKDCINPGMPASLI